MAHAQDLRQLRADHDDRLAFGGELVEQVVDLLLGAHVDTARGLIEDEDVHLGRIKVEVYPMLIGIETARLMGGHDEGINLAQLPWAVPAFPLAIGAGDGIGCFAVPDVGTMVWVFFQAGDIYQPVYFAEASNAIKGLPANRETNYPQRRIIKFKKVEIIVDDEVGTLTINTDADVHITANDKVEIIAAGDVDVTATGDVNVQGATINLN